MIFPFKIPYKKIIKDATSTVNIRTPHNGPPGTHATLLSSKQVPFGTTPGLPPYNYPKYPYKPGYVSNWNGVGQYISYIHYQYDRHYNLKKTEIYFSPYSSGCYTLPASYPLLTFNYENLDIITPWVFHPDNYSVINILTGRELVFPNYVLHGKTIRIKTLKHPNDGPSIYLPESLLLNCKPCSGYNDKITTGNCCQFTQLPIEPPRTTSLI